MKQQFNKILIIVQRSNGDVFLSSPLINALYSNYDKPTIDLLVNDDTLIIAKTLNNINKIHLFSYQKKKDNRVSQELEIIKKIYKKYDLSINLTASDRSVVYSILASKYSISAIEYTQKKSWWKKLFLKDSYIFDINQSIIKNNISSLKLLNINLDKIELKSSLKEKTKKDIQNRLELLNIKKFIIFHPSAQYQYKIYPKDLRDKLLILLNTLNIPIIITGSKNRLDLEIKKDLPKLDNIYDFIGDTTVDELFVLTSLSLAYVGMDTLNMHIATSFNKRIFAIFGSTILSTWSPWSNKLQQNISTNKPIQNYGDITIFQADMSCVACGLAGCDDKHGKSDCLYNITPETIFNEVRKWLIK
jgi:heptosyltransferase-3